MKVVLGVVDVVIFYFVIVKRHHNIAMTFFVTFWLFFAIILVEALN